MSKRKLSKDSKISPRKMRNRLAISSYLLYYEYNLKEESNMKNVEEIKDLASYTEVTRNTYEKQIIQELFSYRQECYRN